MAYSADFRERVAIALRHGERTQVEIAEDFGVSVSFVAVLHRRVKETGSSAVLPHNRGRRPLLDAKGLQILIDLVRANDDATLEELRVLLGKAHPVAPSISTIDRVLRAAGITRKKSRSLQASSSDRTWLRSVPSGANKQERRRSKP